MTTRLLPVALVVAAALSDVAGSPRFAFYALLAAVPATAAAALYAYGETLEAVDPVPRLQALLWGAALAFVVLGTAARAPMLSEKTVPRFASSTLVACLVVFLVQVVVSGAAHFREARAELKAAREG